MHILLVILHIAICIALIMIVLLQTGKGADMGAAFGGGSSQTLFGSTGASTFLTKATTVVAIAFMVTSLILAYISSGKTQSSIMLEQKAPIQQEAGPTSAGETVTETPDASAPTQSSETSAGD